MSTPDTVSYLILGYSIIGAIGLIYVISLIVRQHNLQRDLEIIEQLREE